MPACHDKLIILVYSGQRQQARTADEAWIQGWAQAKNDFLSGNGYNDNDNCPPENSNTTCAAY
jgi:hypothetical protein